MLLDFSLFFTQLAHAQRLSANPRRMSGNANHKNTLSSFDPMP